MWAGTKTQTSQHSSLGKNSGSRSRCLCWAACWSDGWMDRQMDEGVQWQTDRIGRGPSPYQARARPPSLFTAPSSQTGLSKLQASSTAWGLTGEGKLWAVCLCVWVRVSMFHSGSRQAGSSQQIYMQTHSQTNYPHRCATNNVGESFFVNKMKKRFCASSTLCFSLVFKLYPEKQENWASIWIVVPPF